MKKLLSFVALMSVSGTAICAGLMSNYSAASHSARAALANPVKSSVSSSAVLGASSSYSAGSSRSGGRVNTTNTYYGANAAANAYRQNQRNNYFINSVPDVDGTCRNKIMQCLNEYCGDVTALPGTTVSTCNGASYGDLYNWSLLCLQRDKTPIVATNNINSFRNNTASTLCIPYVQQELSSYLSMSQVADGLAKSRSRECIAARNELEAAITCHEVALTMGNETSNKLTSELNNYCGEGVITGGSALMVQKFANAGNVGANVWEWVDKAVSLEANKKGSNWQEAMDSVLAGYVNRMNLACGENFRVQDQARPRETSNLQTVAGLILTGNTNSFAPDNTGTSNAKLSMEVISSSPVYDIATATQVVNAGLTKSNVFVQNEFLTSAQMQEMQMNYTNGTKMFVLKDGSRCFTVLKGTLTDTEQRYLAQQYSNCVAN